MTITLPDIRRKGNRPKTRRPHHPLPRHPAGADVKNKIAGQPGNAEARFAAIQQDHDAENSS